MDDSKFPKGYMVHDRRLVCENSKFEVFFDHIEEKNGVIVPDYLVVAPKQKTEDLITGVSILPVVDGKYALLKIYRHAIADYSWEIPKGFIEQNEQGITSATRELEEETGFYCEDKNIYFLCHLTPDAGTLAARIHIFVATKCRWKTPFKASEMGHRELKLFDGLEIEHMIKESAIHDPCTVVAYYRYATSLKKVLK